MSNKAFLQTQIYDWKDYNLLEGEASLYFEDTYLGRTILDARQFSDTMNISLGDDKGIEMKREKNERIFENQVYWKE